MTNFDPRNPTPSLTPGTPGAGGYTEHLTEMAGETQVTQGAGGITVTQPRDSLLPPAPSQEGVGGSSHPVDVRTSDPIIVPGTTVQGTRQADLQLGAALVALVTSTFVPPTSSPHAGEDLEFIRDLETLTEEGEPVLSTEMEPGAVLFKQLQEGHGAEVPEGPAATFDRWLEELQASIFQPLPQLTDEQKELLTHMQSTDKAVILTTLLSLANLDAVSMTDTERTDIEEKLSTLSELIANANEEGGFPFMNIGIPFFIQKGLRILLETPYTPPEDPEAPPLSAYDQVLENISTALADGKMAELTSEETPDPAFTALFSGDDHQVEQQMLDLLQQAHLLETPPEGITKEEIQSIVHSLGEKLAARTHEGTDGDFRSIDQETLSRAVIELMEELGVPPTLISVFQTAIVPALVEEMVVINTVQMHKQLYSADVEKVQAALENLSGIGRSSMPPADRAVSMDYLKALAMALAFMAQIRGLITRLEGMLTDALSHAKLQDIAGQMAMSAKLLETKLTEAVKSWETQQSQLLTAKILRILMPILSFLIALVSLVLLLLSAVSGGATAPLAIALLVGAIALSSAMTVFTFVDMVVSLSTQKSCFEHLFEALKIEDEFTKGAIETGIQVAMAVLIAILTLGTGLIVAIAQIAKTVVSKGLEVLSKEGMKEILKEVLKQLVKALKSTIGKIFLSSMIGMLFSGGLVPQLFIKLFKALGCDDTTAMILASICTLLAMLTSMLALLGPSIKSTLNKIKNLVKNIFKSGAEKASDAVKQAAEVAKKAAENVTKAASQATKAAADAAKATAAAEKALADAVKASAEAAKEGATEAVKNAAKAATAAAEQASKVAEAAGAAAKAAQATLDAANAAKTAVDKAVDLAKTAADKAAEATKKIAEAAKAAKDLAKDPTNVALQQAAKTAKEAAETAISAAKTAKSAADAARKTAETLLGTSFDDLLSGEKGFSPTISATGKDAIDSGLDQVARASKNWLARLMEAMKKIDAMVVVKILKMITQLLQLVTSLIKGVTSFHIADLKLKLAALTLSSGTLEALFEEMKSFHDIGISDFMKKLMEDGEANQQKWNQLLEVVASFINDISQRLGDLHAKTA